MYLLNPVTVHVVWQRMRHAAWSICPLAGNLTCKGSEDIHSADLKSTWITDHTLFDSAFLLRTLLLLDSQQFQYIVPSSSSLVLLFDPTC